ncbi:hypothetical protein DPMN_046559 [Dreissena polymorpha]|uniref:Uncharacterized protein n=2 Tax=Dreissena polymorpha TaxID=45954 RepID=A0A9D4I0M9_DREPO|nr:hypothetical protein DPMN_046559 [Dreissena polymorpha]
MEFGCPVNGCPHKEVIQWQCPQHNSPFYMNAMCQQKCEAGGHTGSIVDATWACKHSFHNGQNQKADPEGFALALSRSTELSSKVGAHWVNTLVCEFGQQYAKIKASCVIM